MWLSDRQLQEECACFWLRAVEEELRSNRRSDMIIESLLAGATVALMIGIGALTLKLRNLRKELITLKNRYLKMYVIKGKLWYPRFLGT